MKPWRTPGRPGAARRAHGHAAGWQERRRQVSCQATRALGPLGRALRQRQAGRAPAASAGVGL